MKIEGLFRYEVEAKSTFPSVFHSFNVLFRLAPTTRLPPSPILGIEDMNEF